MEKIIYIRALVRHEIEINPSEEQGLPGETATTNMICRLIINSYAENVGHAQSMESGFNEKGFLVFQNYDVLLIV